MTAHGRPGIDGAQLRRLRRACAAVDPSFPATIASFAKRVGLSASYVGQLEAGDRTRPNWRTVDMLAAGLGVHPYALIEPVLTPR